MSILGFYLFGYFPALFPQCEPRQTPQDRDSTADFDNGRGDFDSGGVVRGEFTTASEGDSTAE